MRPCPLSQVDPANPHCTHAQTGIRTLLAAALCLFIGLGLGGLWHSRRVQRSVVNTQGEAPGQDVEALSAGRMAVLQQLHGSVEIRFYAVMDPATVPEAVTAFAGRVEQLLAAYRREAGGKITLTRHRSRADAAAAAADGMKPFNLDKGDSSYLGLTVIQANR